MSAGFFLTIIVADVQNSEICQVSDFSWNRRSYPSIGDPSE
jgi:hypothetical protein